MTFLEQISNEIDKIANGDMLQYFADHPEKLKERIAREKKKSMKKTAQPTEVQAKAGNYKKKHIRYNAMEISIENPAGSVRKGTSPDGKEWRTKMHHHYGYIRGTLGKDKDHIDVFIKPGTKETKKVFIVNQDDGKGKFDEHKCMLGFDTEKEAKAAYLSNYEKGWKCGPIVEMDINSFKKWVYAGRKMAPAKEKVMEKKSEFEKVAVPVGSILRRIWTPLGKTTGADIVAKQTLQKGIAAATPRKLKTLQRRMGKTQQRISDITAAQARHTGDIKRYSQAGGFERLVGGRFGTAARRESRLATSRRSLGGSKRSLAAAQTRKRSLSSQIGHQNRVVKPKVQALEKAYGREMSGITARRYGNIAARTALVGTGAYGVGSLAQSRMNRNRYY